MPGKVSTYNVFPVAIYFTSKHILWVFFLLLALRLPVLILLIYMHLDNLVPSNRDNGMVSPSIANVANFAFLGIVGVQVVRVDARMNVKHFKLTGVRADNKFAVLVIKSHAGNL